MADVFAYSRMMGENEEQTVRTLRGHREVFDELLKAHRGRIFEAVHPSCNTPAKALCAPAKCRSVTYVSAGMKCYLLSGRAECTSQIQLGKLTRSLYSRKLQNHGVPTLDVANSELTVPLLGSGNSAPQQRKRSKKNDFYQRGVGSSSEVSCCR
jgi:hypothetical protein